MTLAGIFASTGSLDIGGVLLDILVVLVAAKVAGELAERIRLPSVVGEIIAGVVVGPAAFGLVHGSDVLTVLGELGVVMLLFQVGVEMDVGELRRVGATSVRVAMAGVAAPFVLGGTAGALLGYSTQTAVFLGAALTATSVGITARVFGDLNVLGSREARVVIGAAVADDVLGLVLLTVVVKAVSGGSLSAIEIGGVLAVALLFLGAAGAIGGLLAPRLLRGVARWAQSPGTMTAVVFAMMLAFSSAATAARLAPIIGAFMAGIAVGQSHHAERVHRELAGLGHIFIPVFFLTIGIQIDVAALVRPKVLGITAVLVCAGVIGKLAAGLVAGRQVDRLTVGLGMIPRGEVGLIFASLGSAAGVLTGDLYAALVTVVLLTTLLAPPLLRVRVARVSAVGELTDDGMPPAFLTVVEERRRLSRLLSDRPDIQDRIDRAPYEHVLAHHPDELVRQANLMEPPLARHEVRVAVTATAEPTHWVIDIAAADRPGLLSAVSGALATLDLDVRSATIVTWADGAALDTFAVIASDRPRAAAVAGAVETALGITAHV